MITNGDSRLFFQFVAAIVPALLFGGVLAQMLKPPSEQTLLSNRYGLLRVSLIVIACIFLPVIVEVIAVSGTVGYPASAFQTYLAALYVVGATAGVGFFIAKPWLRPLLHELRQHRRWLVVLGVSLVLTIVVSARTMSSAVTGIQDLNDQTAELKQLEEELNADLDGVDGAVSSKAPLVGNDSLSIRQLSTEDDIVRADYLAGKLTRRTVGIRLGRNARLRKKLLDIELQAEVDRAKRSSKSP